MVLPLRGSVLTVTMSHMVRDNTLDLQQLTQLSLNTTHLEVSEGRRMGQRLSADRFQLFLCCSSRCMAPLFPPLHFLYSPSLVRNLNFFFCSVLQIACEELEQYISSITHGLGGDLHVTRLHGSSAFKDARTAAEQQIFAVLQVSGR